MEVMYATQDGFSPPEGEVEAEEELPPEEYEYEDEQEEY